MLVLVGIVVSGWWYWYTFTLDPQAFSDITKTETVNWSNHNVRPFYYYWSFFTQSGIWTIPAFIGLLYPYLKNRVFNKKGYLFTFLWTMISVILLSLIPEKKSRYLLPVLIPLALNTGFYIEYLFRKFKSLKNNKETFPVYFNFGLIVIIGLIFPIVGYIFLKESLTGNWFWFGLLSLSLFSISILIFKELKRKNIEKVFYLTIIFIVAIIFFGMPIEKTIAKNPNYKNLSELNSWQSETKNNVYEFNNLTPELIWDYGKPMKIIIKDDQVSIPPETSFGVLVRDIHIKQFFEVFKNYGIKKISQFDLNPRKKGSGQYHTRLSRNLYLLTTP